MKWYKVNKPFISVSTVKHFYKLWHKRDFYIVRLFLPKIRFLFDEAKMVLLSLEKAKGQFLKPVLTSCLHVVTSHRVDCWTITAFYFWYVIVVFPPPFSFQRWTTYYGSRSGRPPRSSFSWSRTPGCSPASPSSCWSPCLPGISTWARRGRRRIYFKLAFVFRSAGRERWMFCTNKNQNI